jgi:RimJ/RimL family protein N-acetyltransferase
MPIPTPVLENAHVRLEPIADAHREGLRWAAGSEPDVFQYMPADLTGSGFDGWMDWSLNRPAEMVWTVIDRAANLIAGSTRFLNVELAHKRVEIGYTWYSRRYWGGAVNPSCKYLLFRYGFETLGLNRIELKTDARNSRSRQAIARLGAKQEGIFRRHMVVQGGHIRDTVYFSVIAEEWPQTKSALLARLAAFD